MKENDKPKELIEPGCCLGCKRHIGLDELYGAFGLCSQCLASEGLDDHDGG